MLEPVGDRPDAEGDPIVMRGDSRAAESWATRCGGARDKRACLLMRMLGRLELAGGWNHAAKHIARLQNILADGISRWPRSILADKVREQTNSSDWYEQKVGTRGSGIFDIVLQAKNIRSQDDDML